jgi:hypothetical protein
MLTDRYDLALSTASSAARDAYVQGCAAKLTMYPGAIEAFDRARRNLLRNPRLAGLRSQTEYKCYTQNSLPDSWTRSIPSARFCASPEYGAVERAARKIRNARNA